MVEGSAVGGEEAGGGVGGEEAEVEEAVGGAGEGIGGFADDGDEGGAAGTGDEEGGGMGGELEVLEGVVVAGNVEGDVVLGEEVGPVALEDGVVAVRAVAEEGMVSDAYRPGGAGGGELLGKPVELGEPVAFAEAGFVAVEDEEGDEGVGGGEIDAIPGGGEFPAGGGVGAGVGEFEGLVLAVVVVVAEGHVEGEVEAAGIVQVFEEGSPLGVGDAGEAGVEVVAGGDEGVDGGGLGIAGEGFGDVALLGGVGAPVADDEEVHFLGKSGRDQEEQEERGEVEAEGAVHGGMVTAGEELSMRFRQERWNKGA